MPNPDKELTDTIVKKAMTKIRDRKPASPTDIPILDDDAVGEIEREPWCHSYGDDRLEAPLESRRVAITVGQRDALCQTVRVLRAENERLNAIVSAYENQDEEALEEAENL